MSKFFLTAPKREKNAFGTTQKLISNPYVNTGQGKL
jgi:hypothetical protein